MDKTKWIVIGGLLAALISTICQAKTSGEDCLETKLSDARAARTAQGLDPLLRWDEVEEFRKSCGLPPEAEGEMPSNPAVYRSY